MRQHSSGNPVNTPLYTHYRPIHGDNAPRCLCKLRTRERTKMIGYGMPVRNRQGINTKESQEHMQCRLICKACTDFSSMTNMAKYSLAVKKCTEQQKLANLSLSVEHFPFLQPPKTSLQISRQRRRWLCVMPLHCSSTGFFKLAT